MLSKVTKALRTDPAGFPRRAASAMAERGRLDAFRLLGMPSGSVVHYGVHRNGNAGDTALFTATRMLFDTRFGAQTWTRLPVRAPVRPADIDRINAHARAVVVGGGGLIIPDSVSNSLSGWQWNIALKDLERLDRPLVLNAVGYNAFHGQSNFADRFGAHVVETVRKSAFVGLRNTGSIRSLSAHLPPELTSRLRHQPCPTTVLSYLLPAHEATSPPARDFKHTPGRHLSINLAFDRVERRFNGQVEACVRDIADAAHHMVAHGWRVSVAIHDPRDRFFLPLLRRFDLTFDIIDIAHAGLRTILDYYRTTDLTIGMRGHGQMVPFGLQRPIFTLSSHPKMDYFLEDIGQSGWGVDIREPGFRDALIAGMESVVAAPEATYATLQTAQARLWKQMQDNLTLCTDAF